MPTRNSYPYLLKESSEFHTVLMNLNRLWQRSPRQMPN